MNHTIKTCSARSRCRSYTTCKACAKIRQARFADRAEHAARMMVTPVFYVLTPDDTSPAGIEYARRWFQRVHRPVAGVWSVESGEFKPGYHLNIIADLADISAPFKGHIYAEPIRSTVRAVAAYMTKAERAATREQGFARQTGDLGPAANWLKKTIHEAPIIAGAQALHELAPGHLPPTAPGPETPEQTAKRWLTPIYDASDQERAARRAARTKQVEPRPAGNTSCFPDPPPVLKLAAITPPEQAQSRMAALYAALQQDDPHPERRKARPKATDPP